METTTPLSAISKLQNISFLCSSQESYTAQIKIRDQQTISTLKTCCVGFAVVTFSVLMTMYWTGTPPTLPIIGVVTISSLPALYKLQRLFANVAQNSMTRTHAFSILRKHIGDNTNGQPS